MYVVASNASVSGADDPNLRTVRVDLVFRILPGPGNYRISAGRNMVPGASSVSGGSSCPEPGGGRGRGRRFVLGPVHGGSGSASRAHSGPGGWDPITEQLPPDTAGSRSSRRPPVPTGNGITRSVHGVHPRGRSEVRDARREQFRCFVGHHEVGDGFRPPERGATAGCPWLSTVPQAQTGWDGWRRRRKVQIPDGRSRRAHTCSTSSANRTRSSFPASRWSRHWQDHAKPARVDRRARSSTSRCCRTVGRTTRPVVRAQRACCTSTNDVVATRATWAS
jgi:hypothetical protein